MDRLVDYFAVIGYDFNGEDKENALRGKVITRIPENDLEDHPFTPGVELFCQPGGWFLSKDKMAPTFFVVVLTNEEGHQQYCAVHSFSEPLHPNSPTHASHNFSRRNTRNSIVGLPQNFKSGEITENGLPSNSDGNPIEDYIDEDMCKVERDMDNMVDLMNNDTNTSKAQNTYAPKCLVLLSRVHDFRILKNCLGLIYTVYIEGLSQSIENIIAKMLLIKVPPPGSSLLRFSIGAADKQALQTPESNFLPVTRSSVSMLLRQLGILNVLNILCAALVDQKLLFYSCSYTRLTEACNALTALMYPFKYSYPYIPILPLHLLECTSSPTPFLFGIHSSFKNELHELLDVITVDLDGGVISIPECVNIPNIPEPYYTRVVECLTKVLCPDLVVADYAYPPEQVRSSEPERLDKEIRSIFLRLFCQLLMGYRSCLQVCRIHPKPIIRFQKENYLTTRGFDFGNTSSANEFAPKLLESQAFTVFVQENGPPFRKLHKFDEVVCEMSERIQSDMSDIQLALKHIKELASDLYINENPNHLQLAERIPKPSEGANARVNQRRFPKLSSTAVQAFMEENKEQVERQRPPKHRPQACKRVPEGVRPLSYARRVVGASSRRLEVLKNCLSFIFESRTLETKKIFQAVIRALKARAVRFALSQELASYAKTHTSLDNQQFDYIARLINSSLQDSSGQLDEYTLAADMLPVVTCFHRKLGPTVTQFMYSGVQDHPVWSSSGFWESAFFDDIQDEICNLYKDSIKNDRSQTNIRGVVSTSSATKQLGTDFSSRNFNNTSNPSESHNYRRDNQLSMEIAAIQLEIWDQKPAAEKEEMSSAEEGVVFSQAMHNAQRMVYMLVPLDSSRINRSKFLRTNPGEESSSNSYFTNSMGGSTNGSFDEESGFEDAQESGNDVSAKVSRFISKFVDRVCTEACISNDHTKTLLNKIPPLVHMQVESLRDVCRESKRLPPIIKSKLLLPKFLTGESFVLRKPLRAYLVADGRATATGGVIGGPSLLPAEGAIFVTNYRVIFIGVPCDALAAEQVVIRSFPVSTLFKVKTFNVSEYPHIAAIDNNLQRGVQLRSSTFQLLMLAFDEEVSSEDEDLLQTELHNLRYPSTIEGAFALSSLMHRNIASTVVMRNKSGSVGGASNSVTSARMSNAKILYKQAKRKAGLDKPNRLSKLITTDAKSRSLHYTPASGMSASVSMSTLKRMPVIDEAMTKTLSDKDTMNRLFERSCEADYKRMNLFGNKLTSSRVNRMFSVCKSYPACLIVPKSMTDEQIKSLAHCHHQGRFPAIVWMHSTTNALLLRSSAIRSRTANSIFKHGQSRPMSVSDEGTLGSSSEEERFLLTVASLVVLPSRPQSALFRQSSLGGRPPSGAHSSGTGANGTLTQTAIYNAMSKNAQLYVFGDKSQLKNIKHEQQGKVMFVPVELPEPKHIRFSFKALMKSCLPADLPPVIVSSNATQQLQDTISVYLKGVQESLWLEQVSQLIQTAGSIVDVMDIHGASVMLAIDDGADAVPQLSSLSQILLDSHYRTIEGFQTLIQKEWLSFAHRFCHRNRFNDIESSGFTPVFLMFLDTVYQIHQQFPMSFEFNSMYLEVLAYHSMSNRFNTFLLDSDYERLEAGILFEKKRNRSAGTSVSSDSSDNLPGSPVRSNQPIKSLWEYMNAAHKRSPIFMNPLYCPDYLPSQVLRPISAQCRLKVWPYYVREALGEGPSYDGLLGELTTGTSHNEQEATETSEVWGGATGRRVVNGCYDNIADAQPDSIKSLLNKVEALQGELGIPVDSWDSTWKNINSSSDFTRKVPENILQARDEVRTLHKGMTVDVIHKISTIREEGPDSHNDAPEAEDPPSPTESHFDTASLFESHVVEVRTYEGSLWKQGALMKHWKLRYFVLDTTKHELRQYENQAESARSEMCKSIIDLKDLESVERNASISGAPKGSSEKACFEVRISKRQYHFIAESENDAKQWVDNLQAALQ